MNLLEKMQQDLILAMKEKDKEKLTVLRMIKAAMQLENINHKKQINEELFIDVVAKQIKMRKESILEFEKGNRMDLIEATQREIAILNQYLPKQLDQEELEDIIDEAFFEIKPTSNKDMGLIMKQITPKVRGKADMKWISDRIRKKMENI